MTVQTTPTRISYTPTHAVRHGLAGTRHVPKERNAELKLIEEDLVMMHQPDDATEMEVLRDMAVANWQVGELERQHVKRVSVQLARSADVFDAQAQAGFRRQLANWREDPVTMADSLTAGYLGVKYVENLWRSIAESLAPEGSGVSLEMAWEAVMAEGQNPAPARISGAGEWVMKRCLAASADPDETLAEWLERAGAHNSKNAQSRARAIMGTAPDAGIARSQLRERAEERLAYWGTLLVQRKSEYEALRQQFGEAGAGMGLGDAVMERDSRLANRYRVTAQNRLDKLVRRLTGLKTARLRRFQKEYDNEQREKRRKETIDFQAARLSDDQFRRYNEQLEYNARRQAMLAQAEMDQQRWERDMAAAAVAESQAEDEFDGGNNAVDQDREMKIQSTKAVMSDVLDEVESPREMTLSISPVAPRTPSAAGKPAKGEKLVDWDAEQDLVCRHPLKTGMFKHWPDELVMGRTKEVLAYLMSRERNEKRQMPLAMFWYAEVNSRSILRGGRS